MSLDITFTLTDADLEHFRDLMRGSIDRAQNLSEEQIKNNCTKAIQELKADELPAFISQRVDKLSQLMQMIDDAEWQLPEEERKEVLIALAYFCEPADLVPDHIPVLGYMDDAIMIELLVKDLADNFDTYGEFCTFRDTERHRRGADVQVSHEDWLSTKRRELHRRLRDKRSSRQGRRIFSRVF
ncbi:YkvA family protein [Aliiglaciecola sp. CAU 1673]|uniref:YkvA family protein n=1 Tax=Aliiglaciecola sp. CAU 1673 TaxID=3032595 RepID=UPI0023DC8C25|nr:YkvA family protein [Aliiglaciecola sp. CAU 1673]MDF2178511.1 YkvA family protein [Aliiglaciecola sp. CAU 1673]